MALKKIIDYVPYGMGNVPMESWECDGNFSYEDCEDCELYRRCDECGEYFCEDDDNTKCPECGYDPYSDDEESTDDDK